MPVRPTYPGVYVEEIASGVRPIAAVATSTAAFIGTFRKGLVDEAVQLLSIADFEREYGGLDRASEASYAVQQFFLNGGSEAIVTYAEKLFWFVPPWIVYVMAMIFIVPRLGFWPAMALSLALYMGCVWLVKLALR